MLATSSWGVVISRGSAFRLVLSLRSIHKPANVALATVAASSLSYNLGSAKMKYRPPIAT
jgi:hypothetical protein